MELEIKQVMLLGHSDSYTDDKQMQVTIAYNHFGEGLIQRMPRYHIPMAKIKDGIWILSKFWLHFEKFFGG